MNELIIPLLIAIVVTLAITAFVSYLIYKNLEKSIYFASVLPNPPSLVALAFNSASLSAIRKFWK